MTRSNKYLSLTIIFSTAIALTGCLANPGNQNTQNGFNQPATSGFNNNTTAGQYGLVNGTTMSFAEQRMTILGFKPVVGGEINGTKLYAKNNQCVQLVGSAKGILDNVLNRNINDCYPTGQNSGYNNSNYNQGYNNNSNYNQGYNNNPNYNQGYNNQNSGYNNNGAQPVFGQTPAALNDFVGARAGQAEGALMSRGYVLRKSTGLNSFWEETASGGCVSIVTNDGRYQSLVYTAPEACR
jgi:hypothetical protein